MYINDRGEIILKVLGKIALAVALFGSGLGIGTVITSGADGLVNPNAPGTANDPIVTKSYVDEAVKTLAGQVPSGGGSATNSNKLIIVDVKPGQILAAGEGTEFIVRAGKAIAFSNTADGISDMTDGKDLKPGTTIPLNHLLLFPREGRGIQPAKDAKASVVVMVRGAYSHLDANGTVLNK